MGFIYLSYYRRLEDCMSDNDDDGGAGVSMREISVEGGIKPLGAISMLHACGATPYQCCMSVALPHRFYLCQPSALCCPAATNYGSHMCFVLQELLRVTPPRLEDYSSDDDDDEGTGVGEGGRRPLSHEELRTRAVANLHKKAARAAAAAKRSTRKS